MKRAWLMVAVVVGLACASIVAIMFRPAVLGLDLQGGVEVVLEGQPTPEAEVNEEAIDRSVEVIRSRVDAFGVAEPTIQTQGDDEIIVQLPGVENPETVVTDLIQPAQLQFFDFEANLVGPEGDPSLQSTIRRAQEQPPVEDPRGGPTFWALDADGNYLAGPAPDREALRQQFQNGFPGGTQVEEVPAGWFIATQERTLASRPDGPAQTVYFLLMDEPALLGRDITEANSVIQSVGLGEPEPVVTMQFSDNGRAAFSDITGDIARRGALRGELQRFAIVLDGEIISTPTIDFNEFPTGIDGRNGAQIQGGFSQRESQRLADQLNSGAIPINLEVISQKQVSATLGEESLRQGLVAGLIGLALVVVFLIAYYRVLGLVAVFGLAIYGLLFYAVIVLIPITLTLPGIAGIILTIGVASDANVVIFERVREEARKGVTPRAAVLNGYKRGLTSIIDANVVTMLTALIIFLTATAGVRGFAFTLMIGVIISFFTAVVATRAVFEVIADTRLLREERFLGLKQRQINWNFDWVGRWKLWLAISFIPILIGMGFIAINGLNLGLDFKSGTRIVTTFAEQPTETQVRTVLTSEGIETAEIQSTEEEVDGEDVDGFTIRTTTLQPDQLLDVRTALNDEFGVNNDTYQVDVVGPTFGEQVIRSAIIAIALSFVLVVAYLWLRFRSYKLALPALLSVVQDVLLSISIYAFTGREVTSATVAALLTILGYSLYDVVIVFDRIRENVPLMRGAPYRDVVNRSVAQMFNRSLITTFTTLLPIVSLFIFGGETLKDFAFALMVGIFTGGASSIIIAAPLAALWKERDPDDGKKRAKAARKKKGKVSADSDVVDLDVLERAERSLESDLAKAEIGAGPRRSLDDEIAVEGTEPAQEPEVDELEPTDAPEPASAPEPDQLPEPVDAPEADIAEADYEPIEDLDREPIDDESEIPAASPVDADDRAVGEDVEESVAVAADVEQDPVAEGDVADEAAASVGETGADDETPPSAPKKRPRERRHTKVRRRRK